MALNKFVPASFNKAADFGVYENVTNENTGISERQFVTKIKGIPAMAYTRSIYQSIAASTMMPNSRQIVVFHNTDLLTMQACKFDGRTYRISQISPDDSPNPNAFDIVFLQDETTVEDKNG